MISGADFLDVEDLLEIAARVIPGCQVRDLGLLAGAAARPRASALGVDAYPTLVERRVAAGNHTPRLSQNRA